MYEVGRQRKWVVRGDRGQEVDGRRRGRDDRGNACLLPYLTIEPASPSRPASARLISSGMPTSAAMPAAAVAPSTTLVSAVASPSTTTANPGRQGGATLMWTLW